MKSYMAVRTNQTDYKWLVIATSYVSPISVLDDIVKELKHESGHILFDLTLINGVENNRYIAADMQDGTFVRTSFRSVQTISDGIKSISRKFFIKNPQIVDTGVISNSLKYLIKDGVL